MRAYFLFMALTKGLNVFVFTSVLLDVGIIARETFTALLLIGLASTALTVPMVSPRLRRMPANESARP